MSRPDNAPDPSAPQPPELMKVFDNFGRELKITREEWRDKVLKVQLQQAWNEAGGLAPLIVHALRDDFHEDVIEAAEQLQRIDPNPTRSSVLLGLVYLKNDRLADAEQVLTSHLEKHGDNGAVLVNLAKVYGAQGHDARAEETLWRGLQADPNQDNAVAMYAGLHHERGGEAAALEACRRMAELPGSWRAQLYLASAALKTGQLEAAQALHADCLSRCGRPVPPDVLQRITGDLGMRGHLVELVQVAEPLFEPAVHGIVVGNNLFRAYVDLGLLDQARLLVDRLYALKRPDWKESLSYWDQELAQTNVEISPADPSKPMHVAILSIEGPVWLNAQAPAAELFEAKEDYSLRIAFLGSSAETETPGPEVERQLADAPGRLSRMIPLYLAEQVHLGTVERTQALMPWVAEAEGAGFVFAGYGWDDDSALQIASQGAMKSDYVVITHLLAKGPVWTVQLRLLRAIDGVQLGTLSATFSPAHPQQALPRLSRQLLDLLADQAEAELQAFPIAYQPPVDDAFPYYLLRLEQLLATRCAATDGTPKGFLNGEREILDGMIQLCLAQPASPTLRVMLAQALATMKKVRPDIMPEFAEKVTLLQSQALLPEPMQGVVQRMVDEALGV